MAADPGPAGAPSYAAQALDLARRAGYPALCIEDVAIGPGRAAWRRWLAGADRLALIRALGALRARAWRVGLG